MLASKDREKETEREREHNGQISYIDTAWVGLRVSLGLHVRYVPVFLRPKKQESQFSRFEMETSIQELDLI